MPDVLDTVTRERLARLIVDQDGPYERTGREIAALFRHADWPDPVDYDGSYRVPWVDELLTSRAGDRNAVERILRRLCDQREYDDPRSAVAMRDAVNRILNTDGLAVAYRDGQNIVIDVTPSAAEPAASAPVELTVDIADFVHDHAMVGLLRSRLGEAMTCRENGAYFAAIVTVGSLLEGVLHAVVQQRDKILAAESTSGTRIAATSASGRGNRDQPNLYNLIDTAHRYGLIKRDAKDFAQVLREYRNFVHPRSQLERNVHPDADLATICWNVAIMTLNDLGASHSQTRDGDPRSDGPKSSR
ncbi:hypothetical protein [Frankia sp. Cj3]|uniref:hypothetical protein n=1 Tax=Frankia sp. Cj3 TaxID=2880976 RepID=UPI001EF56493|nr:hypothetical protein [Frankia sp. Cj3]